MVALGLVVHFLMLLTGFARRQAQRLKPSPPRPAPAAPLLEPVLARGANGRGNGGRL